MQDQQRGRFTARAGRRRQPRLVSALLSAGFFGRVCTFAAHAAKYLERLSSQSLKLKRRWCSFEYTRLVLDHRSCFCSHQLLRPACLCLPVQRDRTRASAPPESLVHQTYQCVLLLRSTHSPLPSPLTNSRTTRSGRHGQPGHLLPEKGLQVLPEVAEEAQAAAAATAAPGRRWTELLATRPAGSAGTVPGPGTPPAAVAVVALPPGRTCTSAAATPGWVRRRRVRCSRWPGNGALSRFLSLSLPEVSIRRRNSSRLVRSFVPVCPAPAPLCARARKKARARRHDELVRAAVQRWSAGEANKALRQERRLTLARPSPPPAPSLPRHLLAPSPSVLLSFSHPRPLRLPLPLFHPTSPLTLALRPFSTSRHSRSRPFRPPPSFYDPSSPYSHPSHRAPRNPSSPSLPDLHIFHLLPSYLRPSYHVLLRLLGLSGDQNQDMANAQNSHYVELRNLAIREGDLMVRATLPLLPAPGRALMPARSTALLPAPRRPRRSRRRSRRTQRVTAARRTT